MTSRTIHTDRAPRAIGPYSQAVRAGHLLYVSGQVPVEPATGKLVTGTIEEQTRRVMESIGAILEAAGASYSDIVKTTIYLTDLANFAIVNATYGAYFSSAPPARATIGVAALPLGAAVEIEVIAYLGSRTEPGLENTTPSG